MRPEDYDIMHALEADYWWFAGMRQVVGALLGRHVLRPPRDIADVGCGTGINMLWMAQQFRPERIIGCDYSSIALGWCRETLKGARSYSARLIPRLSQGDVRKLPFAGSSFDLVTCLDVLDSFPPDGEDMAGLSELHRILRPGGMALVREPAYRWLLSSHDEVFETKHRYTAAELRRKMARVGFEVVRSTYANTLLFPVAAARRLLRKGVGLAADKTDAQPWPDWLQWLNTPFRGCLRVEAYWLSRGLNLPFGLSVICIGRKKANSPAVSAEGFR